MITLSLDYLELIGLAAIIGYCIKNSVWCKFYSRKETRKMELKTIGDSDFTTIKEAAKYMGVSVGFVHDAIQTCILPAFNIQPDRSRRACWRIHKDELEKFLADCKNTK